MSDQKRPCIACYKPKLEPTELQTCTDCIGNLRAALTDIVDSYAMLHDELVDHAGTASPPGSTIGGDNDGLADAMVLLAGGMNGTVTGGRPTPGEPDGNREHAQDQWPTDPSSVVGVLAFWEDDWRLERKLRAAQQAATVAGCASFLSDHLAWAAQHHAAFDEFAHDVRQLRAQLKVATRQQTAVDCGQRIRCDKCGEPFVRHYRKAQPCDHQGRPHCDHSHANPVNWPCHGSNTCGCDQGGRRDDWECLGCHEVIDDASYWLRVKQAMDDRQNAS